MHGMTDLDLLIDSARAKFRAMIHNDPSLFGGAENPRIDATIATHAAYGSVMVPSTVDHRSTQGMMAAVDLTLLDKKASARELEDIAQRAKEESAAAVCVYPEHVPIVQRVTSGSPPAIAVVGFPFVDDPVNAMEATLQQTRAAIQHGAKEIDMVLARNFKDGTVDHAAHYTYIRQVVAEAAQHAVPVKVILETAYLTDAQKVDACLLAKMAGATFVKTSTGFAEEELMRPDVPKGATVHDVVLMRRSIGDTTLTDDGRPVPMGVKASGGIRDRMQAQAMYEAGASRIGASGSIDLCSMAEKEKSRRTVLSLTGVRTPY